MTVAGDVVTEFTNGSDDLNFTSVNHSVQIRASIDGQRWIDPRDAEEADPSDPANITWSGGLLKEGTQDASVDTSITLRC